MKPIQKESPHGAPEVRRWNFGHLLDETAKARLRASRQALENSKTYDRLVIGYKVPRR